jgi:predicted transporter
MAALINTIMSCFPILKGIHMLRKFNPTKNQISNQKAKMQTMVRCRSRCCCHTGAVALARAGAVAGAVDHDSHAASSIG